MNELIYHSADYSIAQFIEEFSSDLPVIVIVTTGSGGCADELHCISADEVYWISGFQRQKRVVVKEVTTDKSVTPKFLSFPVDYAARFHMVKDRKNKKHGLAMTMSSVVEEMKVTPAPHLIEFENNTNVSFSISGTKTKCATLGLMEIVDTYHQKYLVGHPISDNTMYAVNSAIPVYMDITLDVAAGIKGRSRQTFVEWMKAVNTLARSFNAPEAQMNPDIVQFAEIPDGGHYEYVQPGKYFVRNAEKIRTDGYTPLVLSTESTPAVPPRGKTTMSRDPSPPCPPSSHGYSPRQHYHQTPQKTRLPPIRPVSPALGSLREIKHVSDIPENLEFECLSVEDVAHCLCLLGLWRYAVDLSEKLVDGAMLLRLNKDILVKDFKFAEFDAVQLCKFVGGWRPKKI